MGANAHLIDSHLQLVRAVARRYAGRGEELDDLVQVGAVGLVKASDRFDPSRGVAFATFATPAIEGEIRRHLDDRARPVKVPRDLQKTSRNVRRQQAELAARLGRLPTNAEVAEALKIEESEIERAITAERAGDRVAVALGDEPWDAAATSEPLDGSDNRMLLAASMQALNERERRIVFLRFHADMTERQIARTIGISQAHVSRLLDGALTKLRAELAGGEPPARRRSSGDTTPNRVISRVSDSKITAVDAQQETSSGPCEPAEADLRLQRKVPRAHAERATRTARACCSARGDEPEQVRHRRARHVGRRPSQPIGNWRRRARPRAVPEPAAVAEHGSCRARDEPGGGSGRGLVAVILLVLALQRGI